MTYEDMLDEIRNNKTSGASEIIKMAAGTLTAFSSEFQDRDVENYKKAMVDLGKKLITAQPEMAPLFNLVNDVLCTIEDRLNLTEDINELRSLVSETTSEFLLRSKTAHKNIQKLVLDLITNDSTILTHSYSQTVIRSLLYAGSKGRKMKVIVPESRPMYEGRKTAKKLSDNDIETVLIADMAAFKFLSDVDLVFTGCDTICYAGCVNKIGTLGLAISANQFNVPFYVLCEKSKMLPMSYMRRPDIVDKETTEIFQGQWKFVIHNQYFDITPYEFVTGIVSEDGMVAPSLVGNQLMDMRVSPLLKLK